VTFRAALALAVLAACAACGGPAPVPVMPPPPEPRDIEFSLPGGKAHAARLYETVSKAPPGALLIPSFGEDATAFDLFARKAQAAGMMCLALAMPPELADSPADAAALIAEARAVLTERGARPDDTVLIGAGSGASLALATGAADLSVPACVLVSVGMESHGVHAGEALEAWGIRPVLLVYARGDAYAATTARQLEARARGQCELREYAGSARGTGLLQRAELPSEQVLLWLSPIIGPLDPGLPGN
jgi:hypothetical protein